MRLRTLFSLALVAFAAPAHAVGTTMDLNVYDVSAGRMLPVYRHDGRYYVAGEPGHEYKLSLASRQPGRLLAVASVDGVNAVSGETAAPDQTGYVFDAYRAYEILGWRKSLDRIASFYFTSLGDSYAARTGRPRDVGVIGVAVFREKTWPTPPLSPYRQEDSAADAGAATAAPAPSAMPEAAAKSQAGPQPRAQSKLGTGHGRSQESVVVDTEFERASSTPAEIITIYYDSRNNLIAQGIIPSYAGPYPYRPNPFPNGFVPDP